MITPDRRSPRRLLAGSVGPERHVARKDPAEPRWFEPLHVRDETAARERIAAQVAAGADVVVAPAWRTHRRALLPVGETRQARAWTAAAIRVARDGIELGLERREHGPATEPITASSQAPAMGPAPSDDGAPRARVAPRPAPLVAAPLPPLDVEPDSEDGRLLPGDAGTERDYRDQAGLLADADPDLILVESTSLDRGTATARQRIALDSAVDTGLPTWLAADASVPLPSDEGVRAGWIELNRLFPAVTLLLPPPVEAVAGLVEQIHDSWGGLVRPGSSRQDPSRTSTGPTTVDSWLALGAGVVGIIDQATTSTITAVRAAIDRFEAAAAADEQARERQRAAQLSRAAAMASGGAALWLGESPSTPLPDGFAWLIVDPAEAARLPEDHFQLIAGSGHGLDAPRSVLAALRVGGLMAWPQDRALQEASGMRLISLDEGDGGEPALMILRRER